MPILLAEIAESIDQREMYPVRRPTLGEETSLKHILGHPPSKLMQALEAIKQTHAAEVKLQEARAAAAAEAAAAETAAAEAAAGKSDNLVIFEEIFEYVKKNRRLPCTADDVDEVCAQIHEKRGRKLSSESVNALLLKIATHLGIKSLKGKKIEQELRSHYLWEGSKYDVARDLAMKDPELGFLK
jgi:hypothetical protein